MCGGRCAAVGLFVVHNSTLASHFACSLQSHMSSSALTCKPTSMLHKRSSSIATTNHKLSCCCVMSYLPRALANKNPSYISCQNHPLTRACCVCAIAPCLPTVSGRSVCVVLLCCSQLVCSGLCSSSVEQQGSAGAAAKQPPSACRAGHSPC